MTTKTKTVAKAAAERTSPTKKAASAKKPATTAPTLKPLKDTFTKASLVSHLAEQAAADAKTVEAVLLHLESTIVTLLHKKGVGEFTLPDLFKVTSVETPTTKRRLGKNPFIDANQWFEARPATVRVKAHALKKVKDAAISSWSAA